MGMRGPAPKSADLRILEGARAHRPLPGPGVRYPIGAPDRPKGMTAAARRIWDAYVGQMVPLGILREVDVFALKRLCEDVATLEDLQTGMRQIETDLKREARELAAGLKALGAEIEAKKQAGDPDGDLARLERRRNDLRQQKSGPALATFTMSPEGRRLNATINSLASRICRQELQFGLTPISGQRLEGTVVPPLPSSIVQAEGIEAALCG